ncbi:glycosyltransferase family 2 protein [Porphyromonadaceae bacterium W3.11]|nr:glycosyltransferase family 2 protein [Porphyromonadaceae bacterium W3.11]
MNTPQSLTIIIPCYNEEEVLPLTYPRVRKMLDSMEEEDNIMGQITFINDGSHDRTTEILNEIAAKDPTVQVIHFSRNFGHQAALTAGMRMCYSDYAAVIDADLQDPPEEIPGMFRMMKNEGHAVVYGVREERDGETLFKKWTAKLFYRFLNSMTERPLPLDAGDFRIMNKKVLDAFRNLPEHNKYIRGIISWMGFPQAPYYYHRKERAAGETKYSLSKMMRLATDAIQYFSYKPLKLAIKLGFISVLIGLLLALWVILGKIFGFTYPESGWSSIMIVIIFFGGIQLITIGVLSKYVGVVFDEVKKRPEYIIAETKNMEGND